MFNIINILLYNIEVFTYIICIYLIVNIIIYCRIDTMKLENMTFEENRLVLRSFFSKDSPSKFPVKLVV